MKKAFTILILACYLIVLNSNIAQAQTEEDFVSISDPALVVELKPLGQQFPSGEIAVEISIKSLISSNKVKIDWSYSTGFFKIKGDISDIISVSAGQTSKLTKVFIPQESAISDSKSKLLRQAPITVRVEAFVADRYYLSTQRVELDFNNSMELMPISTEYQTRKMLSKVADYAIWIGTISLIIAIGYYLIKKFINYVTAEDKVY